MSELTKNKLSKNKRIALRKARNKRGGKKGSTLPARWSPAFLDGCDQRLTTIREINRRIKRLVEDGGVDCYQKYLLSQRAAFISCKLETMEVTAIEEGEIDLGVYTQMVNALSGLLVKIGLDKKLVTIPWADADDEDEEED